MSSLVEYLKHERKVKAERVENILAIMVNYTLFTEGQLSLIKISDILDILVDLIPDFEFNIYLLLRNLSAPRENKVHFISNGRRSY